MKPVWIDGSTLRALLPVAAAVAALRAMFAEVGDAVVPPRGHCGNELGELLTMPAMVRDAAGAKVVTVLSPTRAGRGTLVKGVYVLFDDALAPVALFDAAGLTALRTAAVSALATDLLARPEASRLVVFGAGVQAEAHAEAMCAVRGVTEVVVVGRDRHRAAELVERLVVKGLAARTGSPGEVTHADIVCTCTTSSEPVFDGAVLADGAHVNAVGSYRPQARELDDTSVRRARIVVEARDAALTEAGDLVVPISRHALTPDDIVADLREVVTGKQVRRSSDDVTVFKSVGLAIEDLAVAREAVVRMGP